MLEDMQVRNLAPATQRNYIHYAVEFAQYFNRSPELLDAEAIHQYLLYLIQERKVSPESANQCVSALKFLYLTTLEMPWTDEYFPRVKRPSKRPVVLSQEELLLFFDHIPGLKNRAALMTCYGAGLRISEAVALKVSDTLAYVPYPLTTHADPGGTGPRRERPLLLAGLGAMLSPRLLDVLRRYWRAVRPPHYLPLSARNRIPLLEARPAHEHDFFTTGLPGSGRPFRPA